MYVPCFILIICCCKGVWPDDWQLRWTIDRGSLWNTNLPPQPDYVLPKKQNLWNVYLSWAVSSSARCPADWPRTEPAGPTAATRTASSGRQTQDHFRDTQKFCSAHFNLVNNRIISKQDPNFKKLQTWEWTTHLLPLCWSLETNAPRPRVTVLPSGRTTESQWSGKTTTCLIPFAIISSQDRLKIDFVFIGCSFNISLVAFERVYSLLSLVKGNFVADSYFAKTSATWVFSRILHWNNTSYIFWR